MSSLPEHVPSSAVVDFDLFAPQGLEHGFQEAWLALHRSNPAKLLWTERNGGHWIINDGPLVEALYGDYQRLSSRLTQVPRERNVGNNAIPASVDPPGQLRYREVINAALSPKAIGSLEADIRAKAVSLIDDLKPKGACEFVSEFALRLPLEIFMSYAELPLEDIPKLRSLVEAKMRPTGDLSAGQIQERLTAYLDPHLDARSANPGDDLLSRIVSRKVEGRPISRDEARRLCAQLLVAGLDTVAAMLSFMFLHLAEDDDLRRRLSADEALHPAAIEEFLRRFPIVTRVREVDEEITVEGVTMKRGDLVVLPTVLQGMDARLFSSPEHIDLARPRRPTSTFGHGPHRCPGAFLARTELRIALAEWLARIPDFRAARSEVTFMAGFVASMGRLPLSWDP